MKIRQRPGTSALWTVLGTACLLMWPQFASAFQTPQTIPTPVMKVMPPVPKKGLPDGAEVKKPEPAVEILVLYGSEKRAWLESVTPRFNVEARTSGGRAIRVTIEAAGSGEMMTDVIEGKKVAHVLSPASGAFVEIGNELSREKGQNNLFVDPTLPSLVSSPIVAMIWKESADQIAPTGSTVKWADLFDYARDEAKWKAKVPTATGPFRIGHTESDFSNSGLHALFLEVMAATGKTTDLTLLDVGADPVKNYVSEVEKAIPYYEKSTGDLAKRMLKEGPEILSAAIVYENSVIEANRATAASGQNPKVVALYPSEGTFQTEHPIGVVQRPYVTPEQAEASRLFIDYLRAKPQQVVAKQYGFRPSDPSIPIDDLLTAASGVSAADLKFLPAPRASVINVIRQIWRDKKNPAAPLP